LKKVSEVEEEKVDVELLARHIISHEDRYFQIIFSLLDFGGKISTEAWKLLNRLPTSRELYFDIVRLKGVRDETQTSKNWNVVLPKESSYKLLYGLLVLEYLMEDEGDEEEDEETNHLAIADPALLQLKLNWKADFIVYGGFDHLFQIFNQYGNKDHKSLSMFEKNILSFVLKILKNYLTATFAATVPSIYRNLSFIRLFHLSLDFIGEYIKTEANLKKGDSINENELIRKLSSGPGMDRKQSVTFDANAEQSKPKEDKEPPKLQKKDSKLEEKKKEKLRIEETAEFKILVDRLDGDLGKHILNTLNLKEFLGLISSIGQSTLNSGDLQSEDRKILEYCLSI
jgi:hypothetical protein